MRNKISAIIFTKNDIDYAKTIIKEAAELSEEVIIIDSSTEEMHRQFKELAKKYDGVARVKYVAALGYAEPSFEYAFGLAKNEWIMLLFAYFSFNNINEEFKKEINEKISDRNHDIIQINKIVTDMQGRQLLTPVPILFLFRKSKATPRGLIHTDAIDVPYYKANKKDRISTIDGRFYIRQLNEFNKLMNNQENRSIENYITIERFSRRITYEKLISEFGGKFASSRPVLAFYMNAKGKEPGQELSKRDYQIYFNIRLLFSILRWTKSVISNGTKIGYCLNSLRGESVYYNRSIKAFTNPENPNSRELAIQKAVEKDGGLINYLGLQNERGITRLNRMSKEWDLAGAKLLVKLLNDKYENSKDRRHNKSQNKMLQ